MKIEIEFNDKNIEDLHTTVYSMTAAMIANDQLEDVVQEFVLNLYRAIDSAFMLNVSADVYNAQHSFLKSSIGKIDLDKVVTDMRKSIERNTNFDDGLQDL